MIIRLPLDDANQRRCQHRTAKQILLQVVQQSPHLAVIHWTPIDTRDPGMQYRT